jgi:hypothetical protein
MTLDDFDITDGAARLVASDWCEEHGMADEAYALRTLGDAVAFFWEHAGYCVGRRVAGACSLARAEETAADEGWAFGWFDDEPAEDWDDDARAYRLHPAESCYVRGDTGEPDAGRILGSLHGIIGADANYRRVIEAELAAEALAQLTGVRAPA